MKRRAMRSVLKRAMPLSMANEGDVRFTAEQAVAVIDRNVPGDFVECGVWRGGSSIAMLLAQEQELGRVERKVYMLDSFQGLPPATELDGPMALAWQEKTETNCTASLEEVEAVLDGLVGWELVPGWFEDTTRELAKRLDEIALLRLDGDWYDSTLTCLEHLVPLVSEEGVVILDDYYTWDGCARATHDFLSRHDHSYRIRSIPGGIGAYFVKRPHRKGRVRD